MKRAGARLVASSLLVAAACILQQLGLPHYLFKDDESPAFKVV
jgi:hypothetical protein